MQKQKTKLNLTNSPQWRNLNNNIEKQKSIKWLKGFALHSLAENGNIQVHSSYVSRNIQPLSSLKLINKLTSK